MRRKLTIGLGLALLVMALVSPALAASAKPAKRMPFTFYMTHYEMLGDPNDPSGVRYHNGGRPFAKAEEGSTIALSGKGGWDPAVDRATGGGRYTITNGTGAVTKDGTWKVTGFVSFLQLPGWWGIPGFVEKGWQGPKGSSSFSGFLTVKVRLDGLGAGELVAWCLMPTVEKPGDHVGDGITLTGKGFSFTDYHDSEMSLEGMMFYAASTG